jgi:hypothetical protein
MTGENSALPAARELRTAHSGLSAGFFVAPSKAPLFELLNTMLGFFKSKPPVGLVLP